MEQSQLLPNAPAMSAPIPEMPVQTPEKYAGFWRRFGAFLIDAILVNIVAGSIAMLFLGGAIMQFMTHFSRKQHEGANFDAGDQQAVVAMLMAYLGFIGFSIMLNWLYFAFMESSSKQGTIGKVALGITVTDLNGNRISFARATGRYFGKILSSLILCIGYIMAGFTPKKQALHDMIAGTLVVMK